MIGKQTNISKNLCREKMKAELSEDYMVEQAAINWLKGLGYSHIHGSELSPEDGERESYRHVVLKRRFIQTIKG